MGRRRRGLRLFKIVVYPPAAQNARISKFSVLPFVSGANCSLRSSKNFYNKRIKRGEKFFEE
jgi:hypothetical protein